MENLFQNILSELENKMNNSHKNMLNEFKTIRTGIANPQILDLIKINYCNEKMLLKNLSIISVISSNQILIKPFDHNLIPEINKAILSSSIGINPQINGTTIKLIFPQPTTELRKKLIKKIEQIAEKTKIAIRNLRREANNKIKKEKTDNFSEKSFLNKIQIAHDKWIKQIEQDKINKSQVLLKN
ncbi:ribosome-recycling factor [Candidatus Phytoplasma oryzae]|nr:ribosome-recycling factor [Candidatus Phytoplasma oryzae]